MNKKWVILGILLNSVGFIGVFMIAPGWVMFLVLVIYGLFFLQTEILDER